MSFGIAAIVLSFLQTPKLHKKPLGVTLLGLSYGFLGLLVIYLAVWQFPPLLLPSAVFLVVSWGLIGNKTWARLAALLITSFGILAVIVTGMVSTLFPTIESLPLIPFAFVGFYLLWYLTRPHVTRFFDAEENAGKHVHHSELGKHPRRQIVIAAGFLVLATFLVHFYNNPPGGVPVAALATGRSEQGAGELGSQPSGCDLRFWASRGDLLDYSFRSTTPLPAHIWLVQEKKENEYVTIVERIGSEDNGSVWVPQTGNYTMFVANQRPGQVTVLCEIWATSYSLRKPIVLSLFLSLFGAATSISMIHTRREETT